MIIDSKDKILYSKLLLAKSTNFRKKNNILAYEADYLEAEWKVFSALFAI